MRTRTCNHNIYEIYSEIILKSSFNNRYKLISCISDYNGSYYCNIFSDTNYKRKLLLIEKSSSNIVFENLSDDTFIAFNDITKDNWLYSVDTKYGKVIKFKNPYFLNKYTENIEEEFSQYFSAIVLSDEILCLNLIDDYLCFGLSIKTLEAPKIADADFKIGDSEIITLDKVFQYSSNREIILPSQSESYKLSSAGALLFVIDLKNGKESYRELFPDASTLNINSQKISKKNCILVEYYHGYYMTPIEQWIDLDNNKSFQLTYPDMTLFSDNYFITIPSFDYNTFTNFLLFRVSDLIHIDLTETILPIIQIPIENISSCDIELSNDGKLRIDDFEFDCNNLFSGTINKIPYDYNKNVHSNILLSSNLFSGFALSTHTIKSTLLPTGNFDTERTQIGEQLYQLKYNFNKQMILPLAQSASNAINELFNGIDVIIPIPPTNNNRPFQPVIELALEISKQIGKKCDIDYLKKMPTQAIKSIDDDNTRKNILKDAFSVRNQDYKGKKILLFDDLFRSGATLDAAANVLKENGKVADILVLTLTKTRTKK